VAVVVEPFTLDAARVTLDNAPLLRARRLVSGGEAESRATAAREAIAAFQTALVEALREKGLPAVASGASGPGTPRLVVSGVFRSLEQGNRARRAVVGFGLGASRVAGDAVLTWVAAGEAPRVVDRFAMEADSGYLPGGVTGVGAGAQAVAAGTALRGAVGAARGPQEIGTLATHTAERIAAYGTAQGWR